MSILTQVATEENVSVDKRRLDSLSTDAYRKYKMKILEKDFYVNLTVEQKEHFKSLKTDCEIERYFWQILNEKY